MDFELTAEQLELKELVRNVAERECPSTLLRAVIDGGSDDAHLWKTFVELDWLTLTVPAGDGGMGLTAVELVIVLEQLGYVADPTPFLATMSQFVPLVRTCPDPALRASLLGAICGGASGAALFDSVVTADKADDGWVLRGSAEFVIDADRSDELAVSLLTPNGPRIAVVEARSVSINRSPSFDPLLHVATVDFEDVHVPVERCWDVTPDDVGFARTEALAGLSASMVGAAQRVLDLSLEHLRERKQFGVPIGSFQALKHMAVDAFVSIERARALYQYAALIVAERDPSWMSAGSMAKAAAGDCQRIVTQHGIQFFGGLGYTWENDLHLYVRRAKAGELLLGGAAQHRDVVALEAARRSDEGVAR